MEDGPENRPANKSGKKGRPRVDENIAAIINAHHRKIRYSNAPSIRNP